MKNGTFKYYATLCMIIICSIGLQTSTYAQKEWSDRIAATLEIKNIDSAYIALSNIEHAILDKEVDDTIKALLYHAKGQILSDQKGNSKQVDSLFSLSEAVYRKSGSTRKLIAVLKSKGFEKATQGNTEEANTILVEAMDLAEKLDDIIAIGQLSYTLCQQHRVSGEYKQGVEYCLKASEIFHKNGDMEKYIMSQSELSSLMGKVDNKRSFSIIKELYNHPYLDSIPDIKASVIASLGMEYGKRNQPDSALVYLKEALKQAQDIGYGSLETTLLGNMANAYMVKKDYKQALHYYEKEATRLSDVSSFSYAINRLNTGMTQYQLGQSKAALKNLNLALQVSKPSKNHNFEQYVQRQMAYTNASIGNHKRAFSLYTKASATKDSIFSAQKVKQIQELEVKYKAAEKDLANVKLQNDMTIANATLQKRNNLLYGLALGVCGLIYGLYMQWKRNREKSRNLSHITSQNQKIQALNREITHRTKNYLHLASALIAKNKSESTDKKVISALEENEQRMKVLASINHRLTDDHSHKEIPIKSYLTEIVDDLVFSFTRQHDTKTETQLQVDDIVLDADASLYIGLITNELITNTFKHAEAGEEGLELEVALARSGDKITYRYNDNGQKPMEAVKPTSQGLSLISDLIQQLNGSFETSWDGGYRMEAEFPVR